MDRFFEILRERFLQEISKKTGWGKNEIMAAFDKSFAYACTIYAREKGISLD